MLLIATDVTTHLIVLPIDSTHLIVLQEYNHMLRDFRENSLLLLVISYSVLVPAGT